MGVAAVVANVGGAEMDSGEDGGVMTAAVRVTNLKFGVAAVVHVPTPPPRVSGGGGGCWVAEGTARTPLDEDDLLIVADPVDPRDEEEESDKELEELEELRDVELE